MTRSEGWRARIVVCAAVAALSWLAAPLGAQQRSVAGLPRPATSPGAWRLAPEAVRGPGCEAVETDAAAWLRAAAAAVLPSTAISDGTSVLRMGGNDVVQLRNQSDRLSPPYIAGSRQSHWWYDLGSGDLVVGRGPRAALTIPPDAVGSAATIRALMPWAVIHDWDAGVRRVRVAGRCPFLGYPRIVLERDGAAGLERLWLDAASAAPVALVRTEADPLLGPERAEYRYQGWGPVGAGRYPIGTTRYLDGQEVEAHTVWSTDLRLVGRDSIPAGARAASPSPPPRVDTVRIGPSAFLLRSARFTEAVALSADTVVLMDAAAGEARAQADSVWIARLFPGRHPMVLVVSSLAWPHFLGIRYWVARGARVVTHGLGVDFLRDVLRRRWDGAPDLLDSVRGSVAPRVDGVDEPTRIAAGGVELRPIEGLTGETGLLVWLPGPRFLWASDRIQVVDRPNPYLEDLVWSVRDQGLEPRATSGPHLAIVPWRKVDAVISRRRPTIPTVLVAPPDTVGSGDSARSLVMRAARAMGGLETLRSLVGIRIAIRSRDVAPSIALDPHRPPGFWASEEDLRDVAHGADLRRRSLVLMTRNEPIDIETVHARGRSARIAEGAVHPLPPDQAGADAERLAPERLLITALSAPDLVRSPDVRLDGVPYPAVSFGRRATRILFHPGTHLPVALERDTVLATDYSWSVWGDLTTRTVYGGWSLGPRGIRYPRTWQVERNGVALRRVAVTGLDLEAAVSPDSFLVGSAASSVPTGAVSGAGPDSVVTLRPGVLLLAGYFNVLLVAQDDGVVVVEPPYSSAYSDSVLTIAARRFPNRSVKAVVATSYLWPHLGGVRTYVARHIPVYLPAANEEEVRAMARAPHTRLPDEQSRVGAEPILRSVEDSTVLGQGPNRMELVYEPMVGGDHTRRMMVVYLPARHLLHAGDLFLPERWEPTMWRQAEDEFTRMVHDRGWDVESVTGLSIEETPWREVEARMTAKER